jgi:hypothetical protein
MKLLHKIDEVTFIARTSTGSTRIVFEFEGALALMFHIKERAIKK